MIYLSLFENNYSGSLRWSLKPFDFILHSTPHQVHFEEDRVYPPRFEKTKSRRNTDLICSWHRREPFENINLNDFSRFEGCARTHKYGCLRQSSRLIDKRSHYLFNYAVLINSPPNTNISPPLLFAVLSDRVQSKYFLNWEPPSTHCRRRSIIVHNVRLFCPLSPKFCFLNKPFQQCPPQLTCSFHCCPGKRRILIEIPTWQCHRHEVKNFILVKFV